MTRVLIIGATGYVGSAVASELLRSGNFTVYGLARSQQKAKDLATKEIIPVLGSVDDSAAYLSLIKSTNIHIVVDCAGANDGSAKILTDLLEVGAERLQKDGAKLSFVYCSGIWVHGSSYERISDLDPVGTDGVEEEPPRLVEWRPPLERQILASRDVLDVAIVRPAEIYGRESGLFNPFFGSIFEAAKAGQGSVKLPLNPQSRPAFIHVEYVSCLLHLQ